MSEPTKQEISQVFKKLRALGPNKVSIICRYTAFDKEMKHVYTRVY